VPFVGDYISDHVKESDNPQFARFHKLLNRLVIGKLVIVNISDSTGNQGASEMKSFIESLTTPTKWSSNSDCGTCSGRSLVSLKEAQGAHRGVCEVIFRGLPRQ
jgi:hypothetical protein